MYVSGLFPHWRVPKPSPRVGAVHRAVDRQAVIAQGFLFAAVSKNVSGELMLW